MTKLCGSSLMLTLPHHTSSRTSGSSTILLSVGLRPVFLPEYATSDPVDEIAEPFSNLSAASYKNAGLALRWISATEMPCLSRLKDIRGLYNETAVAFRNYSPDDECDRITGGALRRARSRCAREGRASCVARGWSALFGLPSRRDRRLCLLEI